MPSTTPAGPAVPAAADPGLFGPDSQTWRVNADPSMWLAGLRALFLQALHPLAMAGVAQHSGFREDPVGRLQRTAEYVATVSFGTTEQAHRAGARVRGIHRTVQGVEETSGLAYRADDPDLLLWVHCCEVESFLSTFRRSGGQMSDTEADLYYAEQTRSAALVGLDPRAVPSSRAAMATYFDGVRPQLRRTPAARSTALFLLFPPLPGRLKLAAAGWPAYVGLATAAFALQPRWARRLYSLPGLPTTDLAASLSGRALRTALLRLPVAAREGPHLRDARHRLGQSLTR